MYFVQEWKPGQTVEIPLLCAANMDTVMPGQLAIFSDEYSASNIDLSLDQMNAGFHNRVSPPTPKPIDPKTLHALTQQQHDSVQIYFDNQVLTYKFLAYPGFMSEPIVAPSETLHMRIGRVDDGAINAQIDGNTVDTGLAAPVVKPGSWVCYQALGTKPVGIIVQFFERDLQSGEDQPLEPTAASFAQTSGTSVLIDTATNKLVALIKDHPGFVGTRTNSNGGADPAEAQLNWDADRHLIDGVITFPKFANSKNVIGRIVNNAGNGPVLELVETSAAHPGNGDGTRGVYFLSLSPEGNSLIGKWSFHNSGMWLGSDDRSATITLGIKAPSVGPGAAPALPADPSLVMAQHQSVQITVGNRLIIYRFTAYPGFWSEAVVPPQGTRHVIAVWDKTLPLQAQVDGNDVDPASLSCQPGSRVCFRAMGDKLVAVALRFLQREPTDQERGHLELAPSPDDDTRDPPPNRQPLRDALIAFVNANPSSTGDLRQRRQNLHVNMEITWDDKIGMATGSIDFPELNAKKKFEGRIIDDQMNPPYLQLVETGLVDPQAATNADIGMVYTLHLAGRGTALIGSWSYRAVGADGFSQQSDSGTIKISANPPN
jgi:hypothetical protein